MFRRASSVPSPSTTAKTSASGKKPPTECEPSRCTVPSTTPSVGVAYMQGPASHRSPSISSNGSSASYPSRLNSWKRGSSPTSRSAATTASAASSAADVPAWRTPISTPSVSIRFTKRV